MADCCCGVGELLVAVDDEAEDALECLVLEDALVLADPQWSAVDETYAGVFSHQELLTSMASSTTALLSNSTKRL